MKRARAIVVLVVVALAYVAGFWPAHRQLVEVQNQAEAVQSRLVAAEARIRFGEVLGQLLRLSDAVNAKNYGEAATLSSSFFDSVRAEAAHVDRPEAKAALQEILAKRDQVTTAIASTDGSLSVTLKEFEQSLRGALGYPVSRS
ncbi:MAG: hypothetical protein ABI051_13570 [Vicinamibacterales bacterium]